MGYYVHTCTQSSKENFNLKEQSNSHFTQIISGAIVLQHSTCTVEYGEHVGLGFTVYLVDIYSDVDLVWGGVGGGEGGRRGEERGEGRNWGIVVLLSAQSGYTSVPRPSCGGELKVNPHL